MNWQTEDRTGSVVDLRFDENVEKENRGFEIDEVTAYVEGNLVGYLKISNVPAKNYELYTPTVWHYLGSIGGWSTPFLFDGYNSTARKISSAEFLELKARVASYYYGLDHTNCSSYEELMKKAEAHCEHKRNVKQYNQFKSFYKDKPYVDYVNVTPNPNRDMHQCHAGRGIGMLLYSAAAHSLHKNKLKLHASGIQSNDAQRMWKHFEDAGWTGYDKERDRKFLCVDKMPEPNKILQREYA